MIVTNAFCYHHLRKIVFTIIILLMVRNVWKDLFIRWCVSWWCLRKYMIVGCRRGWVVRGKSDRKRKRKNAVRLWYWRLEMSWSLSTSHNKSNNTVVTNAHTPTHITITLNPINNNNNQCLQTTTSDDLNICHFHTIILATTFSPLTNIILWMWRIITPREIHIMGNLYRCSPEWWKSTCHVYNRYNIITTIIIWKHHYNTTQLDYTIPSCRHHSKLHSLRYNNSLSQHNNH